jgi:hypothetical protein
VIFIKFLLITIVVSILLSGCSIKKTDGSENGTDNTGHTQNIENTGPINTETVTDNAVNTAAPGLSARGVIEGNVNANQYADHSFTAPDGWFYATDEEIAATLGGGMALTDSDLTNDEDPLSQQVFYVMMAKDQVSYSNIILSYENLMISGAPDITEQEYLQVLKGLLEQTNAINYVFYDITESEVGGNLFTVMQADIPDFSSAQYYLVRKIDHHMLGIIITVAGGADIDTILDCFS